MRRQLRRRIRFRSAEIYRRVRLYSLVADIVSFVLLLVVGFMGLWNGKSLQKTAAWRSKLEEAMKSGTHAVVDEWESHGLSFPVSPDKIEAELVKARDHESKLRRWRKIGIGILMILGAFFFFFARYLQTLGT